VGNFEHKISALSRIDSDEGDKLEKPSEMEADATGADRTDRSCLLPIVLRRFKHCGKVPRRHLLPHYCGVPHF
jgi:hypothetical protein